MSDPATLDEQLDEQLSEQLEQNIEACLAYLGIEEVSRGAAAEQIKASLLPLLTDLENEQAETLFKQILMEFFVALPTSTSSQPPAAQAIADQFCRMIADGVYGLLSPAFAKARRMLEEHDAFVERPFGHESTMYACRCGSRRLRLTEVQMRRADEAQSIKALCYKCGREWIAER